jgi:anti-sigma-K factor RskA
MVRGAVESCRPLPDGSGRRVREVSTAGRITGTPTAVSEEGPFTVKVSSSGQTAEKAFTIWALPGAALTITTPSTVSSSPNATAGVAYSFTFSATGGNDQYDWSLVRGSLPLGLSLSSSGTISGTPAKVSENGPFTVEVASSGQTASKAFTLWSLS